MRGRKSVLLDLEATTIPETAPQEKAFKSLLERILSSQLVSFFTCAGGGGGGGGLKLGSDSSRYFQDSIKTGAPKAVVQTMKQFPHNARMQRMGCGSLRDMAVDSWSAKEKVIEAGGIEAVLKAMRLHAKDQKVQRLACSCLYNLVAGHFPALLIEMGVIGAVLSAIGNHSEDEDVLPEACDCLLALTEKNPEALDLIRQKLGGMVLAKIENHFRGQNGEIQKKAGELLRRLYL
jgi:hypothetical protein